MLAPGPRTPALWQTYRFVTSPESYYRTLQRRYGDVIGFRSLLGEGLAVLDAELAREVFAAPPETFEPVSVVKNVFGKSAVIAVSGDRHRKLRKLLNPRFHGSPVKAFLAAMQRAIRGHLARFEQAARSGETLVMAEVTQRMALDVIIETVLGYESATERAAARALLLDIVHGFSPSIIGGTALHRWWFPPWRRFVRAREAFDRWVDAVVRRRRQSGALGDDILGVLLAARYEDGSPLSDDEVHAQLLTLLLAGHETSAMAMAWGVHHLLRTPAALHRLRLELDALGPDPAPEALTKLPYLGAVVAETLRIEPISSQAVRICREPFTLGGRWHVAPGQVITIMVVNILRDARIYPEPDRFQPERFLEKKFTPWEFLPFGGGARRCLGAAYAEAQLAMAIAEIVSGWELRLADTTPERSVRRAATMGPARGVRVRVVGRRVPTGVPPCNRLAI